MTRQQAAQLRIDDPVLWTGKDSMRGRIIAVGSTRFTVRWADGDCVLFYFSEAGQIALVGEAVAS